MMCCFSSKYSIFCYVMLGLEFCKPHICWCSFLLGSPMGTLEGAGRNGGGRRDLLRLDFLAFALSISPARGQSLLIPIGVVEAPTGVEAGFKLQIFSFNTTRCIKLSLRPALTRTSTALFPTLRVVASFLKLLPLWHCDGLFCLVGFLIHG